MIEIFELFKKKPQKKLIRELSEEEKEKLKEEKLEKKYGVMKEIPKRKIEEVNPEEITGEEVSKPEMSLPNLILRIEKIDGKLEILTKFRDEMSERATQLAEEIGELRSMILERERSLDKMKSEFEKVQESVSELEPIKIRKEMERREGKILEVSAKLEKIESMVKQLSEENKKFKDLFSKIKSFENLVDMYYDVSRRVSQIKDVKNYVDRVASKVENIFSELNEKLGELENQKDRIEKLDELTVEMTKMLDEMSAKLTHFVKDKDLKDLKKTIEEDVDKMLKSRVPTVRVRGDKWVQDRFIELASQIGKLKSIVENQNSVLMNLLERLEGKRVES